VKLGFPLGSHRIQHASYIICDEKAPSLQFEHAKARGFLETMGYKVRTEVRNVPISLTYQEAKEYSKTFHHFDKDGDGHISIHHLKKALKVQCMIDQS